MIIIEESNVQNIINNYIIHEEKLKESTTIILNHEQIIHELTNLLLNVYKSLPKIIKQINQYMFLFDNIENKNILFFSQVKPVILCNKNIILHEDENDIYGFVDEEYKNTYSMVTTTFQNYMGQYASLNSNKNDTYINTTNKLYALTKPFINNYSKDYDFVEKKILKDQDVYRHFLFKKDANIKEFESFRVLQQIDIDVGKHSIHPDNKPGCTQGLQYNTTENIKTLYEGDNVNIVGYANILKEDIDNVKYFNVKEYFTYLSTIKVNESVSIYFNDFAFNSWSHLLYNITGIIISNNEDIITIKPDVQVFMQGKQLEFLKIYINKPNYCFIYNKKYTGYKYNKNLLKKDSIIFINNNSDIIIPNSISEFLYYNIDILNTYTNLFDIKKYITYELKINYDYLNIQHISDLSKSIHIFNEKYEKTKYKIIEKNHIYNSHIELLLFSKNKDIYTTVYNGYNVDTSFNRYLYLMKRIDYGYIYFLEFIKKKLLKKKYDKKIYEKELQSLQHSIKNIDNKTSTNKKEKNKIIAKKYNSLKDLQEDNDNNKTLYFDTDLDTTRYDLKNNKEQIIISKLLEIPQYKNLTHDELTFEAQSIIQGKRKVKDNDYAILNLSNGENILYVRRKVEKDYIWIKVLSSPFQLCSANIQSFNDITKPTSIVFDPFDLFCKKQQDISQNLLYNRLNLKIANVIEILSFIEDNKDIINNIDNDIDIYKRLIKLADSDKLQMLENMRQPIHIINKHIEKSEYVDFIGDDSIDYDKLYYNADFGDNYTVIRNNVEREVEIEIEDSYEKTILKTFILITEITLSLKTYNYILDQIRIAYPDITLRNDIKNEEKKTYDSIEKLLDKYKDKYTSDVSVRNRIDGFIKEQKEKLEKNKSSKIKEFNYNLIIYTSAILTLIIMIEYPSIIINKIIPKCVKFFSYIGHPISEADSVQSLTAYFACIISSLGTIDDIEFGQFTNINVRDIKYKIELEINKILLANTLLQQNLELRKSNLYKNKLFVKDYNKYLTLHKTFKPNFNFKNKETNNNVIEYLKEINNSIGSSISLKYSFNIPLVINSCCMERLSDDTNFYKNIKLTKIKNTYKFNKNDTFIPKQRKASSTKNLEFGNIKAKEFINITNNKDSFINNIKIIESYIDSNEYIKKDKIFNDIIKEWSKDSWWNENFYSKLSFNFNHIQKNIQSLDTDSLIKNKITLLLQGNYHIDNDSLKTSCFSFLKFKLPTILSKIIHKKIEKKESPLQKILDTIKLNEDIYDPILLKIKNIFMNTLNNVDNLFIITDNNSGDTIKNISIILFIIIKLLANIIYVSKYDDYDFNLIKLDTHSVKTNKIIIDITSSIIFYIMNEFITYLNINDTNYTIIKKKVEELREKNKLELISKYSSNEDVRKLQKQLKTMGIIVENQELPNIDILENDNIQQEEENYNNGRYQGENADDVENDEDEYYDNNEQEYS